MKQFKDSRELVNDFNRKIDASRKIIVSGNGDHTTVGLEFAAGIARGVNYIVPMGDSYEVLTHMEGLDRKVFMPEADAYRVARLARKDNPGLSLWRRVINWKNWTGKRYGTKLEPLGLVPSTRQHQVEIVEVDGTMELRHVDSRQLMGTVLHIGTEISRASAAKYLEDRADAYGWRIC